MDFKITAEQRPAERAVVLLLNGRLGEEALPELERSISEAEGSDQQVYIDLSEVTLIDRKSVQYFSRQHSGQVKVVNCPAYLRRWIKSSAEENEGKI